MFSKLKQWNLLDMFEKEEDKRMARVQLNIIAFNCFLSLIVLFVNLIIWRDKPLTIILILGYVLHLILFVLVIKKHLSASSLLLTSAYVLMVSAIATIGGGLHDYVVMMYPVIIMYAGLTAQKRGLIFSTLLTFAGLGWLVFGEIFGWFMITVSHVADQTDLFVSLILIMLAAWMVHILISNMEYGLTQTWRELAERKRVENELLKLTRAVEQSPASIVITNLAGNIEYVNPRFTQITGYRLDEVTGKNPRILKTDLTPPETYRQLWETVTAGKEWRGEFVDKKKDGSLFYESAIISPITDQNGIITHYLAVKEDITERKQMEQSLNEMRSRLHLLGENLEEAALYIYSHDAEGQPHFEYLSTSMEKVIGVTPDEILQDASRLHSLILPEYMPQLIELEAKSKEDLISFEIEVRQRHAVTGNIHWALLRSTPRRRLDGSTVWYGVQMDITDRKRNENLLNQANEQLHQQNEYLSVLHQVTLDLLNHRNVDELLQVIVDRAVILLDAPFSELMLEKDGELIVKTFTQNQGSLKGDRIGRATAKLSWSAFDTKMPAVLDDYSTYPDRREIYSETTLHAVVDLPVLVRGKCIGVLAMGRSQAGYVFSETQIKNGLLFAQLVALVLDNAQLFSAAEYEISERKQAEDALQKANDQLRADMEKIEQLKEELREQAIHDPLTNLYNRRYLSETLTRELARAERENSRLSVIISDIDHFKMINDTYGHSVGDRFLVEIASLMKSHARGSDIVSRYGGEEFLLVLPGTTLDSAAKRAEEIRQKCAEIIIQHEGNDLKVTMSFGVATYPTHGKDAEEIIIKADKALYRAKAQGRNRTVRFE